MLRLSLAIVSLKNVRLSQRIAIVLPREAEREEATEREGRISN
jgi:hypothetical protein